MLLRRCRIPVSRWCSLRAQHGRRALPTDFGAQFLRAGKPTAGGRLEAAHHETESEPEGIAGGLGVITRGQRGPRRLLPVLGALVVSTEEIGANRSPFAVRGTGRRHESTVRYQSTSAAASRRTRSRPPWRRYC